MENTKQLEKQVLDFKHDIRNPLYIAKSLIEVHLEYLNGGESEAQNVSSINKTKTILQKSIKEIDRVLQTIRRLNQIAKGTRHLETQAVSIKEILSWTVRALQESRCLDHLLLVESIPLDLPKVNVNLVDLEEIFFNLIVNAVQAVRERGRLTISATRHCDASSVTMPRNDGCIMISFEDTGCGIPKDALPYIFEPFYTGRADKGGVGFGLYIVKQLVERNGGRISVESQYGVGTTFTLSFPFSVADP
ncbi:MAG: HAMP domain-containing histidine kinase [Candidatus Omnitrophica bacterium]|nr:HAMP domain-containing histidine kinase [Candidatus Omnitrophota bacterium]